MELRFSETPVLTGTGTAQRAVLPQSQAPRTSASSPPRRCCLDELGRDESARIVALGPDCCARLAALGFCPGTSIRLDRRAPLGDPIVFEVRGSRLALRSRDAHAIQVEVLAS